MEFDLYKKMGAYHWDWYYNNPVYKAHVDKVVQWVKEDFILDAGAGDGLITSKLLAVGKTVHGIDNCMDGVKISHSKGLPVNFISIYALPYPDGFFQAVLMADIIEHLKHPGMALNEIWRVLKPGGSVYITTPDKMQSKNDNPYHVREFTDIQIVVLVQNEGFRLVRETSIIEDIIYAKFQKV